MFFTLQKPNPSSRKLNRLLVAIFTIGLALTSTYVVSAQEDTRSNHSAHKQRADGERGERGKRRLKPAAVAARQTQRAIKNLNLSDEEAAVRVPKIKAVARHRLKQRQALRPLTRALRTAVDGEDEAAIKSALDALKAQQNKQKTKAEALEKELVELLTLRQEAQLTIAGIVNSDSGTGGFGGRRGRIDDGDRRRGHKPDRRRGKH